MARLEPRPDPLPAVVPGTPGGPIVVVGPARVAAEPAGQGTVALDPALLAPDPWHPADAAWRASVPEELRPLALDRWRRAAAAVLEGVALLALPDEPGAPAWWRAARAVEAADRAAPELGLLWPALVDWLNAPELGAAPGHRGAWFVRWRRRTGAPAWSPPSEEEWLAFGRWLLDTGGAAADAPLPLAASTREPGDWEAAEWSFRRVRVKAGPAGARVSAGGVARGPEVTLVGGEASVVTVGSLGGGTARVEAAPAGPVGTWTLRAGRREQRFGAARGIELALRADGSGEVTLADAFIGPPSEEALSLAARFGVSGTVLGRWRLASLANGTPVIELGEVRPVGITVHPRGRHGFAVPAGPILGRAEGWLARLPGTRWAIKPHPDGIEAHGDDLGPTVVLVFSPAG